MIVSEWGAGSDLRLHTAEGQAFDFSIDYQQQFIEHYLPVITSRPYIAGGSYWNFVDFSSAGRAEATPHINNKGVLTADRRKKDVYYYFKSAWRRDVPVVHIATRDWSDRTSTDARQPIKVYTNAAEVSLTVNGTVVGSKTVSNHLALFDVTLQPGINSLEARATRFAADASFLGQTAEDHTSIIYRPVPTDGKQIKDIAINVGSHCYFQSAGSRLTWVPDRAYTPGCWGYVGGEPSSTQTEISCTDDGPLYQTMRRGIEAYRFDVPEGRYEVELLFVDTRKPQAASAYLLGRDQAQASAANAEGGFDISVDGHPIERGFEPGRESGYFRAVRRSYVISHGSGPLTVSFHGRGGESFLSGIRLRRM